MAHVRRAEIAAQLLRRAAARQAESGSGSRDRRSTDRIALQCDAKHAADDEHDERRIAQAAAPAHERGRPAARASDAARASKPAGMSAGSTQRVTRTAAISRRSEKSPSCASPGKPERSIALKPQIDVATPSRSVGQMRGERALRRVRDASG